MIVYRLTSRVAMECTRTRTSYFGRAHFLLFPTRLMGGRGFLFSSVCVMEDPVEVESFVLGQWAAWSGCFVRFLIKTLKRGGWMIGR